MSGKEIRLQRFFSRSRKVVVAAMDHAAFMGPIKGLEDPAATCKHFAGADAVLMMPGMIPLVAQHLVSVDSPRVIARLLWHSIYCSQWDYHESRHSPMLTVAQAVAKGADAVMASLSLHTGSEAVDAENVDLFSRCAQQAHELGIPLLGEFFPARTETMPREELHALIRIGCRVIAELGADMIKTFYTGERFREVVESTPVPILVLGAEKTPTERDALVLATKAAASGARGIVFGRNIFQSCNPPGFIQAVRAVMNENTAIEDAMRTHGLA